MTHPTPGQSPTRPVVMIYEDPITKTMPEGEAELLKLLSYDDSGVEKMDRWRVRFLSDGHVTERVVRAADVAAGAIDR